MTAANDSSILPADVLCATHVPLDVQALSVDTQIHTTGPLASRSSKSGIEGSIGMPTWHACTRQIQNTVSSETIPSILQMWVLKLNLA